MIFFFFSSDCCSPSLSSVVTQRLGCCILRLSSGVSCLSGHRNDSTKEIILKVWLLIKGVQEIWRCYLNNDVIVFTPVNSRSIARRFSRRLNQFYVQVNKGHLRKVGRYSGQNVELQVTTIKIRTVRKISLIKPHLRNSYRWQKKQNNVYCLFGLKTLTLIVKKKEAEYEI